MNKIDILCLRNQSLALDKHILERQLNKAICLIEEKDRKIEELEKEKEESARLIEELEKEKEKSARLIEKKDRRIEELSNLLKKEKEKSKKEDEDNLLMKAQLEAIQEREKLWEPKQLDLEDENTILKAQLESLKERHEEDNKVNTELKKQVDELCQQNLVLVNTELKKQVEKLTEKAKTLFQENVEISQSLDLVLTLQQEKYYNNKGVFHGKNK